MSGLLGKKIGITRIFNNEDAKSIVCTLLEMGPCKVTQVKTIEKDGYKAIQLGYGVKSEKNTTMPLIGHFKKSSSEPLRKVSEFKEFTTTPALGDTLLITDVFVEGDLVDITSNSKGKGFQGVVKRHNFSGVGGQTHGQHNRQRHGGSIGACSFPGRVFKGTKMSGRTGNDKVTVQNLKVVKIYPDKNLMLVSGSVAGHINAFIKVQK